MTTNVFHYWQLILCWRLSFYFSKIYWWLFPFDYRESQTAQLRPASEPGDRQYSDFDRTDTRSSLASYGRMAVDFRRELSVPPTEESSRQSSPNLHEVEEKEIFHPSSDDNFFKISNPVSERLADFESEINGCAQDTVNFHKPSDNRRQTCWNGVGSNDFNAGDQPEEDHIYETVNVRKTASESLDKSPSPSNILSSWWVLNVRCVKIIYLLYTRWWTYSFGPNPQVFAYSKKTRDFKSENWQEWFQNMSKLLFSGKTIGWIHPCIQ